MISIKMARISARLACGCTKCANKESRSGPLCSYKRGAGGGGLPCHVRGLVISGPSTGLAPYSSRRMLKMALSMVPSTRLRIVTHCWGERPEQMQMQMQLCLMETERMYEPRLAIWGSSLSRPQRSGLLLIIASWTNRRIHWAVSCVPAGIELIDECLGFKNEKAKPFVMGTL
ncbi:hypothetical protein N5P37_005148 [Trichoderma harzianum]|uniref:Uncharacterized protein n=1 Tax=Trichoderma harzianum CBS 226.95 TaxID=983964 RepID=A0A2T4ADA5_TRIHA|nr:hypothetical protein M431DRAFT_530993 [Trichoderma harzianum CBS 226.95]KAK0762338.1 hypothetical protein N5P37_005148 [Trichoderma harzianum]PTB54908.1 hypothetical protein M431DRAFT_530993 [Trichoderma harzianum CBS 226.95]